MKESKLTAYISRMNARERERFRLFVQSPYFNQHEKTTRLLEIIMEQPDVAAASFDRQQVFARLFPGEPFDEQQLFNVMSYLKKLHHRFLAFEKFEEDDLEEELLTLEAAFTQNQFDLLKNRSKQIEKKLSKYAYQDSRFLMANYRHSNVLGYYSSHYEDRSNPELLQRMLNYLDRYYLLEKLKHACHLTANNMKADWNEVDNAPTGILVNTLSLLAPYPPEEKQALLEAPDLKSRAEVLVALTEVALSKMGGAKPRLQ